MNLTLLIDLDDTLLDNSMDTFIPSYLRALSGHMAAHAPPDEFVGRLFKATEAMTGNDRPTHTLKETFDAAFYAPLGLDHDAVQAPLAEFYAQIFPQLQELTKPRPQAVRMVSDALARGYRIAIATAPIFPRAATYHRLTWAGLPVEEYDFDLVSTYEGFHFTKPNPAYFAELLAQIGWPEGPVVMVGNDLNNDISPARRLGLPTYWVTRKEEKPGADREPLAAAGWLDGLLDWIDAAAPEGLQPEFDSPAALLAIMKATPAALGTLTRKIPPSDWGQRPRHGEWGLTEVLCHLRDFEREVNLPRLDSILNEDNPTIAGQETDTWAGQRKYRQQDGQQALADFISARLETIGILSKLEEDEWGRSARHTIFGPTDLQELMRIAARHDRLHLHQVWELTASKT